jgi:hypothetical protein
MVGMDFMINAKDVSSLEMVSSIGMELGEIVDNRISAMLVTWQEILNHRQIHV